MLLLFKNVRISGPFSVKYKKHLIKKVSCFCMMIMIAVLVVLNVSGVAVGDTKETSPLAVTDQSEFTFQPVPEGTRFIHDFIIKNQGNEKLLIEKVQTA